MIHKLTCTGLSPSVITFSKVFHFIYFINVAVLLPRYCRNNNGLGFLLAIFLFAAVREQLEVSSENPKAFDGFPIALVTAGLMALAFMGFSGLKVW